MTHATTPPLEYSDLFSGIKFFVSRGLNSETAERLRELLSEHGATEAERVEDATHALSTSECFIGANEAKGAIVVTPAWAERSVLLGKIQDPRFYSADPHKLFSGVTATSSDLPLNDSESIAAGIVAFGGQWRPALTNDVTHLFCLSASGPKYAKALSTKDSPVPIQVVVPHWFSDCFKTETLLPTKPYLFPNPPVLDPDYSAKLVLNGGGGSVDAPAGPKATAQRRLMRAAVGIDAELGSNPSTQPSSLNKSQSGNRVLGGKRIIFSARAVQNEPQRDDVFRRRVEQVGGIYISGLSLGDCGVTKEVLDDSDVYITIYRGGDEYDLAATCNIIIGTPAWILYVTSTGLWSDPKEHLLHYPYYERTIPGFEDQMITITNYTGDAREYLKKLIAAMGGKFTPSMTSKNTCVIASHITVPPHQSKQNKIEKAREWRIPIVNHLWLEDSFRAWSKMALSDRKYTEYPPGVDWMHEINARGIGAAPMPEPPREKKTPSVPTPAPVAAVDHSVSNGAAYSSLADLPPPTEDAPAITPLRPKASMSKLDKPRSTKSINTSPDAPRSKNTASDSAKRKFNADTSHSSKRAKTGRPSDPVTNNKGNASPSKGAGKSLQSLERTQLSSFAKESSVPSSAFPVEPVSPEKRGRKSNRSSDDEGGDSSSDDEPERPSLTNRSSNDLHTNNLGGRAPRAAATAAQDRLRNVVMPDVQKFQNEMQSSKGDVRKMEKQAEKQQRRASTATRQDDDAPPAKKKKTQVEDADVKPKKPSSKPSQSQNTSKKEPGKPSQQPRAKLRLGSRMAKNVPDKNKTRLQSALSAQSQSPQIRK
ncbi:PTCB-BRCT domain protein [Ceratobasidium sp. AG-Ba]|nr:PTCB-BRCT domain protein [Ceratobasidium sp. AG-Ba]